MTGWFSQHRGNPGDALTLACSVARSEQRSLLEKCAQTALNSKLIAHQKEFFGEMAVDAVLSLEDDLNLKMIGVKKVAGGSLTDSVLVKGVAFKKTFSYAGFEQQVRLPRGFFVLASHSPLVVGQPKKFSDPLICLLNVELELKSEKDNAEVRIKDVAVRRTPSARRPGIGRAHHFHTLLWLQDYQAFVDAEWKIIYDKLDAIVATGAKVVLSRLAIGDLATQYFADRDIFCAGRVTEDVSGTNARRSANPAGQRSVCRPQDMERVAKATGGAVQNTCSDLIAEVMGKCGNFEEVQVGAERYNFFKECPEAKTATIVLRGGAEQFIEEVRRTPLYSAAAPI